MWQSCHVAWLKPEKGWFPAGYERDATALLQTSCGIETPFTELTHPSHPIVA
jgi:hypothetical protein